MTDPHTEPAPTLIRAALPGDAAALAELSGELGYPASPEIMRDRVHTLPADGSRQVLVAEINGRVVAWMEMTRRSMLVADEYAEITGLVVSESQRGRGIGRTLVDHAAEWARARGLPRLRVRTNEKRSRTHAFYESCGFTLGKSQRVYERAAR